MPTHPNVCSLSAGDPGTQMVQLQLESKATKTAALLAATWRTKDVYCFSSRLKEAIACCPEAIR